VSTCTWYRGVAEAAKGWMSRRVPSERSAESKVLMLGCLSIDAVTDVWQCLM
jgi:hypothetical protein